MKQYIFTSDIESPEIFIKLGEKCPTQCNGCFYGTLGSNQYEKEDIIHAIKSGIALTQENFVFFLYGVDTILNPFLDEYLSFIYKHNRRVILQINDRHLLEKKYLSKIISLRHTYPGICFLLSKTVTSSKDIYHYFSVLQVLQKLHITNIRCDFSLDFDKFEKILRTIPSLEIIENKDFYNKTFSYFTIKGSFGDFVVKNNNKKILEGCTFTHCIFPEYFTIGNQYIIVKDHIEIDIQGYFRFHHPICFLSDIKVSHINFDTLTIKKHFLQAQKFFQESYKPDMKKSCYDCITAGYTYQEK